MRELPGIARAYVGTVIVIGLGLMAVRLPDAVPFGQPVLFVALLALSSMTAARKVRLPLTTSGSTMSVSYAVDFASLLLLGPHQTMLVAAGSAFSQCHLNSKDRNPLHRTLFSMASLVHHGAGAGLAFQLLGGSSAALTDHGHRAAAGRRRDRVLPAEHRPRRHGDRAVDARRRSPTHLAQRTSCGARRAISSAPAPPRSPRRFVTHAGYWVAPLTFAPLYLTYRTYKVYMGRIEDEQRHVQQTSDLHLATIEALARAIDAKDQTTQMHIRRVQVYAAGLAQATRPVRPGNSGRQDRGAAARHRQARGARAHPVEARAAHAGGVPEDPHPPAGRRRDHRRRAIPLPGGAADPQPPRAVGRQGLSARARRRRHPARRAHPDDRRLLRCGDDRAARITRR